jgi:hypothetical protein
MRKIFGGFGRKGQPQISTDNLDLRVIGARGSGKTAYVAALALWPNANPDSPVQSVEAFTEDGQKLIDNARKILGTGLELEPTSVEQGLKVESYPNYAIRILLKPQFSLSQVSKNGLSYSLEMVVNCKDYPGEFFNDIVHKPGDRILNDYLDDCITASGIVILLDGSTYFKDGEYANSLSKFLLALDRHAAGGMPRRIALAISKCEQPELWVNRHDPKLIAQARFKQVCRKLEGWQSYGNGEVEYFALSAFGTLGKQFPEANAVRISRERDKTSSHLKDPDKWRPFGLVSPIYWLCTGKRHKQLDKD